MTEKPILQVEHLSFSYQDQMVLENVNFDVSEGDFIGIIGPNGGGKTTLLKLIMGFLKPNQGTIKVFGKAPSEAMQHIGYVPQTIRLDKQFPISVLEVVLLGRLSHLPWYGRYQAEDLKAAEEVLEKIGILDLKERAFGTLSGGQAQRTLIARALVSNPELLLLDEPTASVDANAQAEIYQLLFQLNKKMTVMMVTHDLSVAIEHVKHVLCVQRTVLSLEPQEVCHHFAVGLYHAPLVTTLKKQNSK